MKISCIGGKIHFKAMTGKHKKDLKRKVKTQYCNSSKQLGNKMKEAEINKLGRYHMTSKMDFINYMSSLSESDQKEELWRLDLEYVRTKQCVHAKLEGILQDLLSTAQETSYKQFVDTELEKDLMHDAKEKKETSERLLTFSVKAIHRWHSTSTRQKIDNGVMKARLQKMAHLFNTNLEAINMKIKQELNEN